MAGILARAKKERAPGPMPNQLRVPASLVGEGVGAMPFDGGDIVGVKDQTVMVKVAEGVELEFVRTAINTVETADTEKD